MESLIFKLLDSGGSKTLTNAGRNRKVVIKETISPIVIIQPKSITGLISLKTKDKNAHIVVKTAYKIGNKIDLDVCSILKSQLFLNSSPSICMYLTR